MEESVYRPHAALAMFGKRDNIQSIVNTRSLMLDLEFKTEKGFSHKKGGEKEREKQIYET